MSVTWAEIEGFWKFLKEDNVDMDAGEEEWRREQEKERERQEAAMKKMKNLPNDVRSKLGARFQEGQVRKGNSKSYLLELRYFSVVSFIWAGQNIHIIYHCVPSLKGLREDMDKHLLANPFPEEGEGYRPV